MTTPLDDANAEQVAYWNGDAGRRWTAIQDSQDRLFTEITAALFEAAAPQKGEAVIDVGCGAGETTLIAAAATGRALGIDVSEPMLARARERGKGSRARFELADATAYDFSAEAADLLISRFGVMFFADPVASFTHLAKALRRGGRLAFVCWRTVAENPWANMALELAIKEVGAPPPADPEAPGPFAFANPERVRRLLEASGFASVQLSPFDTSTVYGATPARAAERLATMGPAMRLLAKKDDAAATARVMAALEKMLAPLATEAGVPLTGAAWIVTARRP